MYAGRDQLPADNSESEVYGFDFINDLLSGETISSAVWSLSVKSGTDASPSSHLIGSPSIVSATKTAQRISGLLQGVTYIITCTVTTNLSNTKVLWTKVFCEQIT